MVQYCLTFVEKQVFENERKTTNQPSHRPFIMTVTCMKIGGIWDDILFLFEANLAGGEFANMHHNNIY